jgi:long-chain acyl-CoA synthetase
MAAVVEFDTLPQLFLRLEDKYSGQDRPILRYKDRITKEWTDISWEHLGRLVRSFAAYLHAQGVKKGDRVAILSENRPEWTIADMASQLLGAINVSLYTSLPAGQVSFILQDSGSKVFVVSTGIQLKKAEKVFDECPSLQQVVTMSELRGDHPDWVTHWDDAMEAGSGALDEVSEAIRAAATVVEPSDIAALIYTSGTTGTPKGAMITHENFCSNANSSLKLVPFGNDDHHLSFLPLCHVFERTAGYVAVLAAGAQISYAESVNTGNRNLAELGPTVLISVPRLFERIYNLVLKSVEEGSAAKKRIFEWATQVGRRFMVERKKDPLTRAQYALAHRLVFAKLHQRLGGNLRFAVSGGAALPAAIGEFFQSAGIIIIEGYGLTETSPVLTINPFESPLYGTVGRVIPGVTIGIQSLQDGSMIAEVRGEEYPNSISSTEGEILARGPNIMKGYWNNEKATREAIDEKGWFHTGDVGRFENGRLRITDRIKHMIVSKGGKNIYPGPIEDSFKSVQWIDQIIVIGEGREYLTALVVPDADIMESYAKSNGIEFSSLNELYRIEDVRQLFGTEFKRHSRQAAAHEKIRDFRLLAEPFSVEAGTMTPTLKLRRKAIEREYRALIEQMYKDIV